MAKKTLPGPINMRSILFLVVTSFFVCSVAFGQPELYKSLKKVKVFTSTRQDVERLFKYQRHKELLEYDRDPSLFPEDDRDGLIDNPAGNYHVSYELGKADLDVIYSTGRCSENNKRGYDLEKDVVIDIELRFNKDIRVSKFDFDLTKFRIVDKPYGDNPMLADNIVDREWGVQLSGTLKETDRIEFSPSPFQAEKYGCPNPYPTDSEMEKIFNEKKSVFEKLAQMSNEDDQVKILNSNFTVPITEATNDSNLVEKPVAFSKERWDKYKAMFRETGLRSGLSRVNKRHPDGIVFPVFHKSYWVASAKKGFFYTEATIEPLVDSIDAILAKRKVNEKTEKEFFKNDRLLYKKIMNNWYLFYEYH